MLSKLLGGSNRSQHLPANYIAAGIITAADLFITLNIPDSLALELWQWSLTVPIPSLGDPSLALVTGLSCLAVERWAWPDRDIEHKRSNKGFHQYWLLYEKLIPYHRHPLSHSLLWGLPLRLLWGFWPLLLLPFMGYSVSMLVLARAVIGAIASDCAHYTLDGFSLAEMITGK